MTTPSYPFPLAAPCCRTDGDSGCFWSPFLFGGAEFAKGLSASVGSLGLGRCVESTAPQDFQPGRVAISFFSW
jgi:hypothetical protein